MPNCLFRLICLPLLLAPMFAAWGCAGAPAATAQTAAGSPTRPSANSYTELKNVAYRPAAGDAYAEQMCRLDVRYPTDARGFPTVVWLHPGGLTGGNRTIPAGLRDKGFAVVGVGYRLSPKVTGKTCIEDAAAAVAWTMQNVERLGGDPRKVYVAGHSAGAYLALMLALDERWLAAHEIDPDALAGVAALSGQAITHFTIRSERGVGGDTPVVDDLAPLNHVRKDAPPLLLVTGDREREMLGRYEENAYLWRMLKVAGHPAVRLHELQGFDHGGMAEPAMPLVVSFVREAGRNGRS